MRYFSTFLTIFIWITESRKAASWNYDNSLSEKSKWSYEHSTTWTGLCQTGKEQSPINIVTDTAEDGSFPAFTFTNYDTAYPASIKNNGHSVAITLNATLAPTLTGGGLTGSYVLDHFHFHWESEHTVNGYRFPLEMHLVHYSTEYGSTEEAATHPEGLAVLGVLFDMRLALHVLLVIFVLSSKSDMLKLVPSNENVNQRQDGGNFIEGRSFVQDYPFYRRYLDGEMLRNNEMKKSVFMARRPNRDLPACSKCEVEYHHLDLGSDYVPRFLKTASCKPQDCWYGICKPLPYKISVLRRKKNDEDVTSASLPVDLSDDFVREIKTVTVGCECKS